MALVTSVIFEVLETIQVPQHKQQRRGIHNTMWTHTQEAHSLMQRTTERLGTKILRNETTYQADVWFPHNSNSSVATSVNTWMKKSVQRRRTKQSCKHLQRAPPKYKYTRWEKVQFLSWTKSHKLIKLLRRPVQKQASISHYQVINKR